jgi:PIN domain nuclease of toxin-antitoxin system
MDLLIDTHAFLWFVWNDPRLSAAARSLIVDPDNRKLISVASHWEVAIKVSIGKLNLGEPFRPFMHREITRNNFEILPISLDHSAAVSVLPFHHGDPVRPHADGPGQRRERSHCQCRRDLRQLCRRPAVLVGEAGKRPTSGRP